MPMLIDTHCHLYLDRFHSDLDAVLDRALAAGVGEIYLPAVDRASVDDIFRLADRTGGLDLRAMAGLHPSYVQDATDEDHRQLAELVRDDRVIAVGETGLDYYWTRDHVDAQRESLRRHARWAMETDKPIVIHNRDVKGSDECAQDILGILREARQQHEGTLRGVFHCFSGPDWLAAEVLDLGFYLGLGGTLTFKNGGVPEAIADVPMERIVLETDAPYLAPTPNRGKRNEPAYVRLVAERLAELRGVAVEAIAEQTTANARDLFGRTDGTPST